jgi:predicted RNA polymerase sigma factor
VRVCSPCLVVMTTSERDRVVAALARVFTELDAAELVRWADRVRGWLSTRRCTGLG